VYDVELSIILPAYNEESAVAGAVETYLRALGECGASYEIVVIDDGSTDGTFAAAERCLASHPAVRVLRNERNLGQVATILRGLEESRGEFVMHNGIDLPFDPGCTGRVLARLRDGADVVVVERSAAKQARLGHARGDGPFEDQVVTALADEFLDRLDRLRPLRRGDVRVEHQGDHAREDVQGRGLVAVQERNRAAAAGEPLQPQHALLSFEQALQTLGKGRCDALAQAEARRQQRTRSQEFSS
jgi:hypothetical protein